MEHFFLSSFEKIGKMTFPELPAPQVVKIPDFFLKIFNEVFPYPSPGVSPALSTVMAEPALVTVGLGGLCQGDVPGELLHVPGLHHASPPQGNLGPCHYTLFISSQNIYEYY